MHYKYHHVHLYILKQMTDLPSTQALHIHPNNLSILQCILMAVHMKPNLPAFSTLLHSDNTA